MKRISVVLFFLLGLIWGGSYIFIKIALDGLAPAQLVLTRLVLGTTVLLIVVRLRKMKLPRSGIVWAHISVTAILGMVAPFLLLAWGETRTSGAMAGVLIAATPLLTMVAATTILPTERATWRKAIGLLVGFGGVVLVISPWGVSGGSLPGQLAVLVAAASYAAQTVYVRKNLSQRGVPPLASATTQVILATIMQAAITPFFPWQTPALSVPIVTSISILGVIGTGLAYLIYFRLIGELGATTASAVNYIVPLCAMLLSVILLSEPITWNMIAGTIVVLGGLAFAENRISWLNELRAPVEAKQGGR